MHRSRPMQRAYHETKREGNAVRFEVAAGKKASGFDAGWELDGVQCAVDGFVHQRVTQMTAGTP